jgi:hypothetical protein
MIDEQMNFPRLDALNRQWARTPPLNEGVAMLLRALGWKPAVKAAAPSDEASRKVMEEAEFE